MGGEWLFSYVTYGQYDGVVIVELPDDKTVTSFLMAIGSQGSFRTTILLKATQSDEAAKLMEVIPNTLP